jgi:hypothetical protein
MPANLPEITGEAEAIKGLHLIEMARAVKKIVFDPPIPLSQLEKVRVLPSLPSEQERGIITDVNFVSQADTSLEDFRVASICLDGKMLWENAGMLFPQVAAHVASQAGYRVLSHIKESS